MNRILLHQHFVEGIGSNKELEAGKSVRTLWQSIVQVSSDTVIDKTDVKHCSNKTEKPTEDVRRGRGKT